jgi:very-short-patch-repair endonuclease
MRIYNRRKQCETRKELRGNMTKAELILWSKLRRRQLNGFKFRRQYSINRYIVDFYCTELRLVIEVDGESHLGKENQEYDKVRQDEIESLGISFLRFTNQDVYRNLNKVISVILNYISGH